MRKKRNNHLKCNGKDTEIVTQPTTRDGNGSERRGRAHKERCEKYF